MTFVRKIIVCLVVGFISGIVLASFISFNLAVVAFFIILTLIFSGLFLFYRRSLIFGVLVLIFLGVILGLLRYSLTEGNPMESIGLPSVNSVSGLIISDPDRRDNTTRLIVKLDSTKTKILIIIDNFTDYAYGDKVEITGKLEQPENFLTEQGKVFDYQNYLLVRGIKQISYYPKIKILANDQGSVIKASLFALKNSFLNNLRRTIPEPASTLAGGLILGNKGGLGPIAEEEFRQAGLSHIIVLSGYNITIVAEGVLKFFSWLLPVGAWFFGLIAIFLFVMMTGGEAAAVRSAVMGAIALVARRYGRNYDAGVALVIAGFLMILWNPLLLVFDFGFQLSFLATMGLIYLSPLVEKIIGYLLSDKTMIKLKAHSITSGLLEIIVTTTGAQMAVYPWLLYKAGNASLIGFISNIFVLPAVPFAMFLSFITGIAGFIFHPLSLLISYPTYFLLEYILQGAHFFAGLL